MNEAQAVDSTECTPWRPDWMPNGFRRRLILRDADLRCADLTDAMLEWPDLRGADLRGGGLTDAGR